MRSLCLSFLFFVLSLAVIVPASWPSAAQDKGTFAAQMLAEHNAVRQKFGVQPLVWDEGLAKLAQEWADKIAAAGTTPPEHRASGENLFWGTADAWFPKDILEVWENEVKNYDRGSNNCAPGKICVHFTQVVWFSTTKVGCGKAKGMSKGEATDFIVCDYSPPGNEVGKRPFPTSLTPPLTATLTPTGTPPSATTTPIVTPSPIAPPLTPAPIPVKTPLTPAPTPVTTPLTPVPLPTPASTPNTNTECEDLRKNVRRLSAEEELLSAQLGDYAPPIPFARQIPPAPTSEFTIVTPKPTPRVPVPCYRFVLGGKTRLDHSNRYGIEFMQIPASVTIKSFCMGKYEVTEAQWQAVVGNRTVGFDSGGGRIQMGSRNWPVQAVTWFEAQNFINKLNGLNDGWMYRLPTEAEWEYAARAGTTGNYAGNLSEIAWYGANSGGQAHAVGGKQPNAWGLYDMIGNLFEMSNDGGTLTRIGGSYASPAEDIGGPVRYPAPPASHELTMHGDDRDGFRVVAVPR